MSYDLIERFLRNNLDDDDYKEYSAALDELCTPKRPWVGLTKYEMFCIDPDGYNEGLPQMIEAKLKEKNND